MPVDPHLFTLFLVKLVQQVLRDIAEDLGGRAVRRADHDRFALVASLANFLSERNLAEHDRAELFGRDPPAAFAE